jgi:hypothetical protein
MEQKGVSRPELASKLHVSLQTVNGWLLRSNPRAMSERQRIAIEALIRPEPEPGCIPVQIMLTPEQAAKVAMLTEAEKSELFMSVVNAVYNARQK